MWSADKSIFTELSLIAARPTGSMLASEFFDKYEVSVVWP